MPIPEKSSPSHIVCSHLFLVSLPSCLWVQDWCCKTNHWNCGCYLSTQFVVYLKTIHACCQWKAWSLFGNCLISIPALRYFYEILFLITRCSTHWLTYLKILKQGDLLWAIGEALMIGQHLVMYEEKCLPAVIVRIIIKSFFVIVPCSLIFVCNPTVHYVHLSGPSLYYMCPFFV